MLMPSSLKSRLAITLGLLGISMALVSSQAVSHYSRQTIEAQQRALLGHVAQAMSARLAHDLQTHSRQVAFLASLDGIRDPAASAASKAALFASVQSAYPHLAWIGLTDATGRITAATGGLLLGQNAAARDWFVLGQQRPGLLDAHEAHLLASLLPASAVGQPPLRLLDVVAPVRGPDGGPPGVLAAHLSLQWARDLRRQLLDGLSVPGVELAVLNQAGQVLIGATDAPTATDVAANVAANVTANLAAADDTRYLSVRAPGDSNPLGWQVLATRSQADAFAPAQRLQWLIFAIGGTASLVFSGLLWAILRRQLAPLEAISRAAERIRQGELSTAIPKPAAVGEVAVFARSLADLVNDLRASNAALALTNRVFEESHQGIAICDAQAQLLRTNPAFDRICGWPGQSALGQPLGVALGVALGLPPGSGPTAADGPGPALVQQHSWHGEQPAQRPGGVAYTARLSLHPLRDAAGVLCNIIAIMEDVSGQRRLAAELDQHRNHLEDLLTHRSAALLETNKALSAARVEADRANRAKSDFLANMSHEIRTPLHAILGFAHLLGRQVSPGRPSQQLGGIKSAARHLLGVINDVLDFSKIEAGKLQIHPAVVDVNALVTETHALVAELALAKGLETVIDLHGLPPTVVADGQRIGQVLLNFLSNAVKFTQAGSITVRLAWQPGCVGTVLHLAVTDTGIGLTTEQQQRLFEPFEQADASTTRLHGGTGLGLAISRRLVHLLGGQIGVTSAPGQGSTFWVSLPVNADPAAAARPALVYSGPPASQPGATTAEDTLRRRGGGRVLLAEDNPVNQEVAVALLTAVGLQVDVAENGRLAVDRAGQRRYDLILMDMQMPVMDGLAATRLIRQVSANADTPILAMTANAFDTSGAQCLAAGMDDHITKPIEAELLYRTLLQWLAKRRSAPG